MAPFDFAGVALAALSEGALWWPARRALIVADLHLEKASWFARSGQLLPPYDSAATLAGLDALVARHAPHEIWCLGDNFHDTDGTMRLSDTDRAKLWSLTARTRWTWITGNHDAALAQAFGGQIAVEAEIDGLLLRHEADPGDDRPELSGHFHPKLRVGVRGRLVARRAFVMSERKLILPAFGALTGGLDCGHPAIVRAVGRGARAMVPVSNRMLCFPIAA